MGHPGPGSNGSAKSNVRNVLVPKTWNGGAAVSRHNAEHRAGIQRASQVGGAKVRTFDKDQLADRQSSVPYNGTAKSVQNGFGPGSSCNGGRAQLEYRAVVIGVLVLQATNAGCAIEIARRIANHGGLGLCAIGTAGETVECGQLPWIA